MNEQLYFYKAEPTIPSDSIASTLPLVPPITNDDTKFRLLTLLEDVNLPTDFVGTIKLMNSIIAGLGMPSVNLLHIQPFADTYLRVTEYVYENRDTFQDPIAMERLVYTFAGYYFRALRDYLEQQPILPAWTDLFEPKSGQYSSWVRIGLGANAHINHDLAFASLDAQLTKDNQEDFLAINKMLTLVMFGVMLTYFPYNNRWLKHTSRDLFIAFIRRWRSNAWRDSLVLPSRRRDMAATLRRRSSTMSFCLVFIGRTTQIPKMFRLLHLHHATS